MEIAGQYTLTSHELGRGSFATVFKGIDKKSSLPVAIKVIEKRKLNAKLLHSLDSEIAIMRDILHPNIVTLLTVETTSTHIYIVMEYCSWGDLSSYIKKKKGQNTYGGVPPPLLRHLLYQLSSALQALRERNIVHRDLKPHNILLVPPSSLMPVTMASPGLSSASRSILISQSFQASSPYRQASSADGKWPSVKLADFGFARQLRNQDMAETLCGSPLYMAPEVLAHEKYDSKADLWSVGAILYEMITGRPPFTAANHVALLKKIRATKEISFPIAEILTSVSQGPSSPPSAAQAFDTIAYAYASSTASPHRSTGASLMQSWDSNRVSLEIIDLARALLTVNPVERMSFEEFFLHPAVRNSAPSAEKRKDDMSGQGAESRTVDEKLCGISLDSKRNHGSASLRRNNQTSRNHDTNRNIPPQFGKETINRPRSLTMPETFIGPLTTIVPVDVSADASFDLEQAMGSMIIGIPTTTDSLKQPDTIPRSLELESASSLPLNHQDHSPFPHHQDRQSFEHSQDASRDDSGDHEVSISSSQPASPFSTKSPSPFPSLPRQCAGAFAHRRPASFTSSGDEPHDHGIPFPMDEQLPSLEQNNDLQEKSEENTGNFEKRYSLSDRQKALFMNSPDRALVVRQDSGCSTKSQLPPSSGPPSSLPPSSLSPSALPPVSDVFSLVITRQQRSPSGASFQQALGHPLRWRMESARICEGNVGTGDVRMNDVVYRMNDASSSGDTYSSSPMDVATPKWNEWLQSNQASLPFAQPYTTQAAVSPLRRTPMSSAHALREPIVSTVPHSARDRVELLGQTPATASRAPLDPRRQTPVPAPQASLDSRRQTPPTSRESQVSELVRRQSRLPVDGDVEDDGFVII